jgi:hypothetical protein
MAAISFFQEDAAGAADVWLENRITVGNGRP